MPVPPNHRRKAASVMTRSSGEATGLNVIRIVDMPRGGHVYIDGQLWEGGGHWDESEPNVWVVPNPPAGRQLRVVNASGQWRGRDYPMTIQWAELETGELDWDSLTPMADPSTTGTLRVNGAAHTLYVDDVPQGRPPAALTGGSADYELPVGPHRITVKSGDGTNRQMTTDADIAAGMRTVVNFAPDLAAALAGTNRTRRSITDVSADDSIDRSNNTGAVFSITGVPSDVVSLIVQENGRVLPGTLAGGTWTASSFDVSDAAEIIVTPTFAGGVMGENVRGRAVTRLIAIPAAGLSIAYSTLAAPTTQYRRVGGSETTPPAMTGIVLVGDTNSIGGATFSVDGVAVPYAPGAAQWLATTPAYTKLFIPAAAGAHVVRLIKGGETRRADAAVAAGQVTEIPVGNMTVETRSTNQQVTNSNTGIVLVGDIASIGGATFSVDGVAVPYAPGAAQWLATTPAYTKLFIPAPAGAHVVRLIKGGETRRADAAVAAGQVTEIPVTGMQQELVEIQKSEDKKDKAPPAVLPPVEPVGPIGPPPVVYPPQARLPQLQPGMSTTSKLIIGGLVAAALGGGYYWYSTRPKANPGKKDCGCGCGGKGGCGG